MASNKKINIPISSLSSDEIYALLDSIESDEEEDIENLMNDSDTEFVDRSVVENKDSDMHVERSQKPQAMMLSLILSQLIYLFKLLYGKTILRKNQVMMNHSLH